MHTPYRAHYCDSHSHLTFHSFFLCFVYTIISVCINLIIFNHNGFGNVIFSAACNQLFQAFFPGLAFLLLHKYHSYSIWATSPKKLLLIYYSIL